MWSLKGKFLKGRENLQFQQVFLEIFALLKPEVMWQICIFLCSYWTNKYKTYFYKYNKLWRTTCTLQNCFNFSEWQPWRLCGKVECFLNLPSRRNHGVTLNCRKNGSWTASFQLLLHRQCYGHGGQLHNS